MFSSAVLGGGDRADDAARHLQLRRSQSQPYGMGAGGEPLPGLRALERQVRKLQREVAVLNDRLALFEDVSAQWGLRYTRRMALVGNAFMGAWIFVLRLARFLRKRRAVLLQAMMPKLPLGRSQHHAQAASQQVVSSVVYHGAVHSVRGATLVFAVATALLTRPRPWNRTLGAVLGTLCAGYLSMATKVSSRWPWVVALALAGNLSYLGASLHMGGALLPSLGGEHDDESTEDDRDEAVDNGDDAL